MTLKKRASEMLGKNVAGLPFNEVEVIVLIIDLLAALETAENDALEDEIGWLCELPSTEFGPSWWCSTEHEWTKNASQALRFARKADAEGYIGETGWTDVIATEHMWPAIRAPKPPEKPHD